MSGPLILSIFPGIDLLGRAFEEEWPEACIVRGPDLIFGGDIRSFHPPAGKFDGVIGGPPCQSFSSFAHLVRQQGKKTKPDLIPEFERCVREARPAWFLMENVEKAPPPSVPGYSVCRFLLQNRHLGQEQNRLRSFVFGQPGNTRIDLRRWIEFSVFDNTQWSGAILASGGRRPGLERGRGKTKGSWHGWTGGVAFAFALEAQGLPPEFLADAPFTAKGKFQVVGNGVPLPMGRAVAKAVKRALALDQEEAA